MGHFIEQQLDLFLDRYALRDENGNTVESTPEQMWTRVANAIANTPEEATEFQKILSDFKFVPGGRILAGAGAETEKTFYNCYVIPVETKARRNWRQSRIDGRPRDIIDPGADSREAIIDTIGLMVDIMSRGGGVGINWSVLRPSGSYLARISGTSSGPIGWMDVASAAVGEVIQGGSRRGAAMFMMDDWHPDLLNFIDAKREKGKITNANISVAVSDDFMAEVAGGRDWSFRFPDTADPRYNSEWDGDIKRWESEGGRVIDYGKRPARDVWNAIAESAHASGEPGVVFLDRYNSLSTANGAERIICVNPCGEQGLGAYSVCNLGAMNLDAYVVSAAFDGDPIFNFRQFRFDTMVAIRFLDNVVDRNFYFLPEAREQQTRLRRIGLGAMGLADCLVRLGIRYGSAEAQSLTERIFREMKDAAIWSSIELAKERGPAEAWKDELWDRPYLREYADRYALPASELHPLRNLFLLTQAPTGTTSLLAGVNSGIEPYFNTGYWREDRTGKRWIRPRALEEFPDDAVPPSYVVTSQDVTVEEHVLMQAAVQKYVDSSVSKTINAPKDQTVEETKKAFDLAWESGLKGVAYYRDGSRNVQVLYHQDPNDRISELEKIIEEQNSKIQFLKRQTGRSTISEEYYPQKVAKTEITLQGNAKLLKELVPVLVMAGHPDTCSGKIVFEEGCQKCYSCSWTAC